MGKDEKKFRMDRQKERGFNTCFGLSVEDLSIYDELSRTRSGEDSVTGQSMHSFFIHTGVEEQDEDGWMY